MPTLRVPVLGRISAGIPMVVPAADLAFFDPSEAIDVAADLLPPDVVASELFALQVLGGGLVDASIADGDLVVLQSRSLTDDRSLAKLDAADIVAVWFLDRQEAVLTRLHRVPGGYELHAASAAIRSFWIPSGSAFEVKGKVLAVIRRLPA